MRLSKRSARYFPWALFALALFVRVLTASLLDQPGYTDAYYYAVGARQLASGQGFTEPFIWNYLDPPPGVPHVGFLYWMPLTSILGWLGMQVMGGSFGALQAPFVLLSALLPLVAYAIALDLTGEYRHALLAGLLTVFPGFYAQMLVLPDNFAPFALAGSMCLWAAGRGLRDRRPVWFGLAGLAAGFAHLARADGLLLAGIVALAAVFTLYGLESDARSKVTLAAASLVLVASGYLLVMAPWLIRNWQVSGSPLGGSGTKTLFLTNYDDMFAYGRPLSLDSYLGWGWPAILSSKLDALLQNLIRLWMENLLIVLLPFTALGLWQLRSERLIWPFFLYALLLFLAMTFAFTFPGTRGGLFHSGGALLPFLFAAVGPGLGVALRWAARRLRGWNVRQAWPVFSAGLVGMAVFLTLFSLWRAGALSGDWNKRDWGYARIEEFLASYASPQDVVMVGNSPGFTWHTGRAAISVPNEPLEKVLLVADRYGARYLLLDANRPRTTDSLYSGESSHPLLTHLQTIEDEEFRWQLYEIAGVGQP